MAKVLAPNTKIKFNGTTAFIVDNDEQLKVGRFINKESDMNYYIVYAENESDALSKVKNRECWEDWYDTMIHWKDVE